MNRKQHICGNYAHVWIPTLRAGVLQCCFQEAVRSWFPEHCGQPATRAKVRGKYFVNC